MIYFIVIYMITQAGTGPYRPQVPTEYCCYWPGCAYWAGCAHWAGCAYWHWAGCAYLAGDWLQGSTAEWLQGSLAFDPSLSPLPLPLFPSSTRSLSFVPRTHPYRRLPAIQNSVFIEFASHSSPSSYSNEWVSICGWSLFN